MVACDTVVPFADETANEAEVRTRVCTSEHKYNDLSQIDETSIFTPVADGILPSFVIMYSFSIS
jgi:hypothetical protein